MSNQASAGGAGAVSVSLRRLLQGERRVGWGLFFLLWFWLSHFHQPWTGLNQVSRLDLLHAVFKEGRLEITTYHQNTMDKAVQGNRYFSDKAPGAAVGRRTALKSLEKTLYIPSNARHYPAFT